MQAGAALYRDKGCPQCHGADLNGNKKGPALADIRNDPAWPPEKITKQITDGGPKMPPFGESLTDPEVAQLVAYLRAKDRPAPPRTVKVKRRNNALRATEAADLLTR